MKFIRNKCTYQKNEDGDIRMAISELDLATRLESNSNCEKAHLQLTCSMTCGDLLCARLGLNVKSSASCTLSVGESQVFV